MANSNAGFLAISDVGILIEILNEFGIHGKMVAIL
jgi:hypothetical protein